MNKLAIGCGWMIVGLILFEVTLFHFLGSNGYWAHLGLVGIGMIWAGRKYANE